MNDIVGSDVMCKATDERMANVVELARIDDHPVVSLLLKRPFYSIQNVFCYLNLYSPAAMLKMELVALDQ